MPELPEVETIVRELKPKVIGKIFWKVESKLNSTFLPDFKYFQENLIGRKIKDIVRRGKFIVFTLDRDLVMVIHLRMTGRVLLEKVKKREKFIKAIFTFSDASSMIFSDMRRFGRIWLYNKKEYELATGISKLGVEPFAEEFTLEVLEKLLSGKGILKNKLLDQSRIAGIGNIYADEICFRVGLHPSMRTEKLKARDLENLLEAIQYCLNEGIKNCGASISDFVGTRGDSGKHQKYLKIYGRTGDPCYKCASLIKKTRAAGRGTYYCEVCQRRG